jgi:bifunctional non-homologous end joining protein LigD
MPTLPRTLAPMRAVSGERPPDGDWAFEIKWDGVRVISFLESGTLRLQSSNLIDITTRYPEVAPVANAIGDHTVILDGEMVAFDEHGRPSFGLLQHRMHLASPREARERSLDVPTCYLFFDLLHLDGEDLTGRPYRERRERLEALVTAGSHWQVPASHPGDGAALLEAARTAGLEGLMAKRPGSPYEIGRRSPNWRKVKIRRKQELVIGGWVAGEGNREGYLGALLLGYYEEGALRFAGKVGTGFKERDLRMLGTELSARAIDRCPFDPPPPRVIDRVAHYVRPELVAEIAFGEWTIDGVLRHPSYLGLRADKAPTDVVREPT